MEEEYDVIVVGAGFGGPIAAKRCADAGLRVLMLERSENVGEKVISGLTIPFYGFFFGPSFIRDGNPPIERPTDGIINYIVKDIENGEIDIDDSLRIPKPFGPIFAFGYNTYCKPFCEWEAREAVRSGVILRTSTTVVDIIKENSCINGVITDKGEKIRSKILIDSEGSQGLLAIKAGVRKKYPPETISLADTYDYEMAKEDIDRIFGHSVRFCWGWDEQKISPPLGYGNGLMVWPYRKSLHFMQDQCLKISGKGVPNLKKLFVEYHKNITTKLPWWKYEIAPRIKLRARLWEGFEIFVGLDKKLKKMPNYADGMILIGDAAGLESTELCDGVPSAWFSAEIAAEVAIEAIQRNDVSKEFLKKYKDRIQAHPLIQWSISGTNRYNLRKAQELHDKKLLKKYIHDGWGLGALTYCTTPLLKMMIESLRNDAKILSKWIKMYFRYYQNWLHESFDYFGSKQQYKESLKRPRVRESLFLSVLNIIDFFIMWFSRHLKKMIFIPFSNSANNLMKKTLPLLEPIYMNLITFFTPITDYLSKKLIDFIDRADPLLFEVKKDKEEKKYGQNL